MAKGTGSRKRKRHSSDPHALNAAKMVDAAFGRTVNIVFNGKKAKVSVFGAILLQLTQKALTDRRALRVLSRYKTYAANKCGQGQVLIHFEAPKDET